MTISSRIAVAVVAGSVVIGAAFGATVGAAIGLAPQRSHTSAAGPQGVGDPADSNSWIIDFTGIGPVSIGQDLDQDSLTGFRDVTPSDDCILAFDDGSTRLDLILEDYHRGVVWDITVSTPGPRTREGIGVGSSRSDLLSAYPDLASPSFNWGAETDLLVAASGGRSLTFEVDDAAVRTVTVSLNDESSPLHAGYCA
jgi:hypothetical protein